MRTIERAARVAAAVAGSFLFFACSSNDAAKTPAAAPLVALEGAVDLVDTNPDPKIVEVALNAAPAEVELIAGHSTRVLAFNGSVPGPVLHARVGDRVIVHFRNDLDEPTTIHWHGLRISSDMDGNPMMSEPIAPGGSFTYDFVVPDAGTFWYHPHVNTMEQIERGMYGAIVVEEAPAVRPSFTRERVLVLDDVKLDAKDQIASFSGGMDMMMGRFGNQLLTNGHAEPVTGTIEKGAVERWRLIATTAARPMLVTVSGASFRVVGTDGGLVAPYTAKRLLLAVGQRFDVEVTADNADASEVRLDAFVDVDDGKGGSKEQAVTLAKYAVAGTATAPSPVYPEVVLPDAAVSAPTKRIVLGGYQDAAGKVVMTINGKEGKNVPTEDYPQGVPVKFLITNELMMAFHPFHLHGNFFQVVARNGKPVNEPGLKDTVLIESESVTILTYFENPGEWMYHCHIAEHAMQGMMAELRVVPSAPAP